MVSPYYRNICAVKNRMMAVREPFHLGGHSEALHSESHSPGTSVTL